VRQRRHLLHRNPARALSPPAGLGDQFPPWLPRAGWLEKPASPLVGPRPPHHHSPRWPRGGGPWLNLAPAAVVRELKRHGWPRWRPSPSLSFDESLPVVTAAPPAGWCTAAGLRRHAAGPPPLLHQGQQTASIAPPTSKASNKGPTFLAPGNCAILFPQATGPRRAPALRQLPVRSIRAQGPSPRLARAAAPSGQRPGGLPKLARAPSLLARGRCLTAKPPMTTTTPRQPRDCPTCSGKQGLL